MYYRSIRLVVYKFKKNKFASLSLFLDSSVYNTCIDHSTLNRTESRGTRFFHTIQPSRLAQIKRSFERRVWSTHIEITGTRGVSVKWYGMVDIYQFSFAFIWLKSMPYTSHISWFLNVTMINFARIRTDHPKILIASNWARMSANEDSSIFHIYYHYYYMNISMYKYPKRASIKKTKSTCLRLTKWINDMTEYMLLLK